MRKLYFICILVLFAPALSAQSPKFLEGCDLATAGGKSVAETAVGMGRSFLGKPYVPHTLEENQTEQLVVNFTSSIVQRLLKQFQPWHLPVMS